MCCLSLQQWSPTACKEKDFRLSDARIIAGLRSLSWALIKPFLEKCPHFTWWCKQYEGEGLIIILIHSWDRACHGRAVSDQYVRAPPLVPSSSVQLSEQQIWRPCCSLFVPFQAYQSTPQRALKGSFGDRKPVHVISHISVQFAFCIATQSSPHVSERPVKWDTLALPSWVSVGLSYEGVNSAANRCFHSAYKHSISVSHCMLLPPF